MKRSPFLVVVMGTIIVIMIVLINSSVSFRVIKPVHVTKLSSPPRRSKYFVSFDTNNNVDMDLNTNLSVKPISRLERDKQMLMKEAARLRAEAETLEAEQKELINRALNEIFRQFDLNNDGSISIDELRLGLMKEFQDQITEEQAQRLMKAFDASGDGKLQFNEFKSIEEFRRKLETIILEERADAEQAILSAREAKLASERVKTLATLINDGPPTIADRWVSIIPYLVPLFDSFQYGQKFLSNVEANPFTTILAIVYTLYETIPFSGLIAFFALSFIANNVQLNRLIRFNIQQAIYIDIALIIPSILSGIITIGLPAAGVPISSEMMDLGSTAIFLLFSAAILYSLVSSIVFGQTPNKIPFISDRAEERLQSLNRMLEDSDKDPKPPKSKPKP